MQHLHLSRFAASGVDSRGAPSTMNGLGALATVSTTTTVQMQRQDDDWIQQMKIYEEVERWEKVAKQKLPADLKDVYLEYLMNYSGFIRMPVYQMMDTLLWDHQKLNDLLDVLKKIPRDTMPPMMALMHSFVPDNVVLECLHFLHEFKDYQVEEMVIQLPREDTHLLIQVCRHIPIPEKEALIELANRLPLRDIIHLLKRCNEPMAKGCALCRTRRLHALEQRMINEQVPDGMIKVPGALALYDKATTWTADDEKGFTFNTETADIFWYKQPVDLIQICDKCLLDVNQAITNNGRFDPIHHIDAPVRKGLVKELRSHESGMAEVIYRISHERNNRRGREFALRALEHQRIGLKREQAERDRMAGEAERQRLALLKQQEHDRLVSAAVSVDQKWITFDQEAEAKRLEMRQLYTETKQRFEYELPGAKAPKDRLHPRTWQLAPISASGRPLLPEGAAQIFGTYVPPVVNHDAELAQWKAIADAKHAVFLKQQEDIRLAKRAEREREIDRLCNHVRERMAEIEYHQELDARQKAQQEQQRLRKRKEDREIRKGERFERYLEKERKHMMFEDARSYKLRDYDWQCLHEQAEREDMYNEELDQTEFDRFWGLDLYERIQNEEETRLRKVYEDRVAYLNGLMVQTRAIQPASKTGKNYSFAKVGSLPEDNAFTNEAQRRSAVIKKLKAEEVRSKLKVRVSYSYS